MKLISTLAVSAFAAYDPENIDYNHHNGCLFPEVAEKALISNDPYAQFTLASGSADNGVYSEGALLNRECAVACTYDGTDTECAYEEDAASFLCLKKEGKGARKGYDFYVFVDADDNKKTPKAVLFRTGTYQSFRTAGKKLICPQPPVTVSDPEAVCGEKPEIPSKMDRFNRYTVWTADGTSVECAPNGIFKVRNPKTLNLVCAEKKTGRGYQWLSLETNRNGRSTLVNPANGSNMLKDKYLCKLNPDYVEESGDGEGSGEEGSGADLVAAADVSM